MKQPDMDQPRFFVLINHPLTSGQKDDARKRFGIKDFIEAPAELKEIWSAIPADKACIRDVLEPVLAWISETAGAGDYILVQGDPGGSFIVAEHALKQGLIPMYSTTVRKASEHPQPDGSVLIKREFTHKLFRKYGD